jgi:hypothetical protein
MSPWLKLLTVIKQRRKALLPRFDAHYVPFSVGIMSCRSIEALAFQYTPVSSPNLPQI